MRGAELVADKVTKQPFPRDMGIAEEVARECTERGLLVLPGVGGADGVDGDTVVLGPPYIITRDEIDTMVSVLGDAIQAVSARI